MFQRVDHLLEQPFTVIDIPLVRLDRLRVRTLLLFKPLSGYLATHREARVAFFATLQILIAFILACLLPLPLIAWGTLILGAPHILADLRHLVIRTGYIRRKAWYVAVSLPVVLAGLGGGLKFALVGVMIAALVSSGAVFLRAVLFFAAAGFAAWCAFHSRAADFVFVHAHNFIAVFFWWLWNRRRGFLHWIPLVSFALVCVLLMNGVVSPIHLFTLSGRHHRLILETLTGGVTSVFMDRLVVVFAFAQSVHYGMWLRFIPDEDRQTENSRPFVKRWRALRADCGLPLIAATVLLTVFFSAWGFVSLSAARLAYLNFASFHGYLELVVLAFFLTEGRP